MNWTRFIGVVAVAAAASLGTLAASSLLTPRERTGVAAALPIVTAIAAFFVRPDNGNTGDGATGDTDDSSVLSCKGEPYA